jgi:hypothetical protein
MPATSRQDLIDGLIAARARHPPDRGRGARIGQAALGFVLLVVAVPLTALVVELGVPLLLIALRVLADEFDWAARAFGTVAWQWERFRAWLAAQPGAVRSLVIIATSIVAIVIIALLASS